MVNELLKDLCENFGFSEDELLSIFKQAVCEEGFEGTFKDFLEGL